MSCAHWRSSHSSCVLAGAARAAKNSSHSVSTATSPSAMVTSSGVMARVKEGVRKRTGDAIASPNHLDSDAHQTRARVSAFEMLDLLVALATFFLTADVSIPFLVFFGARPPRSAVDAAAVTPSRTNR
jgi:hypothetical protein